MSNARQTFEAIARANGGTDFSLKQDGRYAVQNIQSRWTYFRLGWEAQRKPLTSAEIRKWWAGENGFEDCNMAKLDDFEQVVRAVEGKHGIKAAA